MNRPSANEIHSMRRHAYGNELTKPSHKNEFLMVISFIGILILCWVIWQLFFGEDSCGKSPKYKPNLERKGDNENPYYVGEHPCEDCSRPITLWPTDVSVKSNGDIIQPKHPKNKKEFSNTTTSSSGQNRCFESNFLNPDEEQDDDVSDDDDVE